MNSRDTAWWAILLVLITTLLTSSAQLLLKAASARLAFNFFALITNTPLVIGCVLYGIGAVLLIIALKHGELSVLYPIISLSFIWVSLLSAKFLPVPESMNIVKWVGIAGVVTGVSFIGLGSRNNSVKIQKSKKKRAGA